MTRDERDAFLHEVHIAVVAVPSEGKAPIATPVWFRYDPAGSIHFVSEASSEKAALLSVGTPFSIIVQDGVGFGAAYVTIECVVASVDEASGREELERIAERYLGREGADLYMAVYDPERVPLAITARPTRFLTRDYVKLGLVGRDGT